MNPNADIRWKQRFQNFERAFVLLRDALENGPAALKVLKDAYAARILEDGQVWIDMLDHRNLLSHTYSPVVFEQAVEAIHTRYLAGIAHLHDFLHREAMP